MNTEKKPHHRLGKPAHPNQRMGRPATGSGVNKRVKNKVLPTLLFADYAFKTDKVVFNEINEALAVIALKHGIDTSLFTEPTNQPKN